MALSHRARKALRITGRALLLLPLVVIVAVAGLFLYARSDAGRETLRHVVLERAHKQMPGLAIGRIGGDYIHDLVLTDVTIRDKANRPAVHVDRIVARFHLLPLLHRRLFVGELLVEAPSIFGRTDQQGVLNLSQLTISSPQKQAAPPRASSSSFMVQIDHLAVVKGKADLELPSGQAVVISELELSGAATWAGRRISAALDSLTVDAQLDDQPYALALAGRASLSPGEIHAIIDNLKLTGVAPAGAITATGQAGGSRQDLGFDLHTRLPRDARSAIGPESQVDVSGRVALTEQGLGTYRVDLVATLVDPHALYETAPPGQVSLRLQARGTGIPWAAGSEVQVALAVPPSRLAGFEIREVNVTAHATGPAWRIDRARARGAGGELHLFGQGEGANVALRLTGTVGDPTDGKLPMKDFHGRGMLTARLDGVLPEHLSFALTAEGARLRVGKNGVAALRLRAKGTASQKDQVRSLAVDAEGVSSGVAAGDARIQRVTLAAHARGRMASPDGCVQLLASGISLGGGVPRVDQVRLELASQKGHLTLHGAGGGPQVKGGIEADGTVGDGRADVTVRQLAVDVRSARLTQSVTLRQPTTIRWRANDVIWLGDTHVHTTGQRLAGDLALSGMYRLDPRGRLDPRAQATLSLSGVSVRGFDRLDLDAALEVRREQADATVKAKMVKATLDLQAAVPLVSGRNGGPPRLAKNGSMSVKVKTNQVNLRELPLISKQLQRQGLSSGIISLVASVEGDVEHPDAKLAFDLHDVEVRKVTGDGRDSTLHRLSGVGAKLNVDSERGTVKVNGQALLYGAGVVSFDAKVAADPGALLAGQDMKAVPLEVRVNVPKFQLSSLKQWDERLRDTEGVVKATALLRGTLRQPDGRAELSIDGARVDKLRFGPIALHALWAGDAIETSVDVLEQGGGSLAARATINRAVPLSIDASAKASKLDITFARLFTSGVREMGGLVDANVRAQGLVAEPQVDGNVYYYDGRLGLVGQPTFQGIGVVVALRPGRLDIQRMAAYSGGGSFIGKGWVTLRGLQPTGTVLTAHADRFVVAAAGSSGARLDGDLAVAGELKENVLAGKVKVPEASLWLPKVGVGSRKIQAIGQHKDVRFVDQAALAAYEKKQTLVGTPAAPQKLDVRATAGTVYVRGKDLDIELTSSLRIVSNADGTPGINGLIEIRRGRINIASQRFDFEHSEISFDGGTDPHLSIRITHQYPDAMVVVDILGTPNKPQLRMKSDPPIYDEAQIVSLILTGQASGEPSQGGSFDPRAAVANVVLGKLADKIAPELGLDVLRVESVKDKSDEAVSADAETRIEVGKYVSERVYLSYAHVFGATENQNRNEAHVEYRMSPRWVVETVFGDAGVGGADALWTYRY